MREKKAQRTKSNGTCSLCGKSISKAGMTRHLKSCIDANVFVRSPSNGRRKRKRIFHIMIEGERLPRYWLHIEAQADLMLRDLDDFLRDVWLECCGHMSVFKVGGKRYEPIEPDPFYYESEEMDIELSKVFRPGIKIPYEYDFGSTTPLTIKVVSEREGVLPDKKIRILARNDDPLMKCELCGRIARQVCIHCIWSDKGWVCNRCVRKHRCIEQLFLPVVNSPRIGMCGYTGVPY